MKLARNEARERNIRNSYKILDGKPETEKPLGRLKWIVRK
jgi:hypothetical protein